MSNDNNHNDVDTKKRRFLLGATATVGAVGAVGAISPFIRAMQPSAKAIAEGGPVTIKVGKMKAGDQLTVVWRGKPIWIIRRDEKMLETLRHNNQRLRDPNSKVEQQPKFAQNPYRSKRPEFLVLVGICTHLGCSPTYRPDPKGVTPDWPGGFFCSCHGSKFDLAGRVYKGVPAPVNLEVPPYAFIDDDTLLIGRETTPERA